MHTRHISRVLSSLLLLLLPLAAQAGDAGAHVASTEGAGKVVPLSTGLYHSCALKTDGSVDCWGDNAFGRAEDQAGPFVEVVTGGYHSCGLKADGSVDCWGASGIAEDQPGPFKAISAGYRHSCGLRADGGVACWGYNEYGQSTVPDGVGSLVAISAGEFHTCGLQVTGGAACWGAGTPHDPSEFNAGQATIPEGIGPFVAISAGGRHTCALDVQGRAWCWGDNSDGQTAPQYDDFVAVSAGFYHSCGVKTDGGVNCWGAASEYSEDDGQAADQDGPFVAISASFFHTCGLTADGRAVCWGAGGPSAPTHGHDRGQSMVPADLGSLGLGQIAAGNAHVCDLKPDGELECWGADDEGQAAVPAAPGGGARFAQVVAGDSHSCAIDSSSKVTCWGRNGSAIMGDPVIADGVWRQLAPGPDGALCALSANYEDHRCVREAGNANSFSILFGFRNITHGLDARGVDSDGFDWQGRPGLCATSLAMNGNGYCSRMGAGFDAGHQGQFAGPWQRLESGLSHQCGLKADGTLECWGNGTENQLYGIPAGTFRAFSVGWNHACAIRDTGSLACWGNSFNNKTRPPAGVYVQVAAGNTFTCAIRDDGKRVCWGAGPGNPFSITPEFLPNGVVGTHYSQQMSVGGAQVPALIVFAQLGGQLPPGLSLSETGLLSGIPTMDGIFTFTIDAEGDGRFAASRTYTISFNDPSPPVIDLLLTPATPDGDNGWHVGDVEIDWTVTDAQSPITSSTGCEATTLDSDTLGASYTCSASSAGGTSSLTTPTLKRDATPPVLAPSVPSPLLRGHSYSASANATDATSGVATSNCGALDTSTLGTRSTTCTAADNAGNSNAVTLNYTVTTTCSNDGYTGTQLNWCRNICEMGYTGSTLNMWIRRWVDRFHDQPYCLMAPQSALR